MKFLKLTFILLFGTFLLAACSSNSTKEETGGSANEQPSEAPDDKQSEDKNETPDEQPENDTTEKSDPSETEGNETEKGNTEGNTTVEFEGITFEVPDYAQNIDMEDQVFPMELYLLDEMIGSNFNVLVEELPMELTINEYIDIAVAGTGFEYLSNEYYTNNGIEWNESVSYNHTENGTIQLNQRTFISGMNAYVFTYASSPDFYENELEAFKAITDSVAVNE